MMSSENYTEMFELIQRRVKAGESVNLSKMPTKRLLMFYYWYKGFNIVSVPSPASSGFIMMKKPGEEIKAFIYNNGSLSVGKTPMSAEHVKTDPESIRKYARWALKRMKEGVYRCDRQGFEMRERKK